MAEWKTIDTAPRDEAILVWSGPADDGLVHLTIKYSEERDEDYWWTEIDGGHQLRFDPPTHWMHLPTGPLP